MTDWIFDDDTRASYSRVVSIINRKGGVLKTTLVANLAGFLAAFGWKVLCVDLDPQANLRLDLGYAHNPELDDDGRSFALALMGGTKEGLVRNVRKNIDVIPGGKTLEGAVAFLSTQGTDQQKKTALARVLAPLVDEYDIILIDCPPGGEELQNNAVAASRWAIIPAKTDPGSIEGIEGVADRIRALDDINPDVGVLGVVITDVSANATQIKRRTRREVSDLFGDSSVLFDTTIRHTEATAQQARKTGKLAIDLDLALDEQAKDGPKWWQIRKGDVDSAAIEHMISSTAAPLASDFAALTTEIINRIAAAEQQASAEDTEEVTA